MSTLAPRYDLAVDFGLTAQEELGESGYSATAPFWIIAVVRYKQVVTYDRASRKSFASQDTSQLIAEAGKTLIITDDCISLGVHQSKASHVSNLSSTLQGSEINYLTEILPGDWCMAWILQSEEQGRKVLSKIRNNQSANDFMDGLKFVGKIHGIRKSLAQGQDGKRTVRYNVQASGFTEFDAPFFYDPKLALTDPNISQWLARLQIQLSDFVSSLDQNNPGIDINKAIPALVELLLGRGLPQQFSNPGNFPNSPSAGLSSTDSAPFAFVIPSTIGKLLGKQATSKPIMGYSDIFEAIYGVQKYNGSGINSVVQQQNPSAFFLPEGTRNASTTRRQTDKPMLGSFLPNIPQFQDTNIWTALTQYLNPTINEMYTCLRVNSDNKVVPTLIVRQLPFSTAVYSIVPEQTLQQPSNNLDFLTASLATAVSAIGKSATPDALSIPKETVTEFLELPRWVAPAALIYKFDIGRTNTMRFNFVYLAGQADPQKVDPVYTTIALLSNPPLRDDADIKRNGLRMARNLVACSPQDVQVGPQKWMDIKADILMGQHLTLNGVVEIQGIQAPICVGDNFEFDDVVLHIEAVSHTCVISGGRKYFHTTLELTNGVNVLPNPHDPLTLYAGMTAEDQTSYNPGITTSFDPVDNSVLRDPKD